MLAKVNSAAIAGLEARLVEVEVDIARGLPAMRLVGLPDKAVEEAKERVISAIKNSDAILPNRKITVNLAPADIKKQGSIYDLPIAVGILSASEQIMLDQNALYLGELSLDGQIRKIKGALAFALLAEKAGFNKIYLPEENANEAAVIKRTRVIPVFNLNQLLRHLRKEKYIKPIRNQLIDTRISYRWTEDFDISHVKGQELAKRALLISAAGGHNLLMSGPPGTGKTLLAKSIISILPPLSQKEALEVSKIYSIVGRLTEKEPIVKIRPFRSPHHSASSVSIIGGGQNPKPGEISLAHHGVLFLDELAEFHRDVLESLRQPLEDQYVSISRARETVDYPANFALIAAQNPCPCGYLTHPKKDCICTGYQIRRYQKKISGPILDRFDLFVELEPISFKKLTGPDQVSQAKELRRKVFSARQAQKKRFKDLSFQTNSQMNNSQIKRFCQVTDESKQILEEAVDSLNLSARSYFSSLKVARTIADLDYSKAIKADHIAESLQFRLNRSKMV